MAEMAGRNEARTEKSTATAEAVRGQLAAYRKAMVQGPDQKLDAAEQVCNMCGTTKCHVVQIMWFTFAVRYYIRYFEWPLQ